MENDSVPVGYIAVSYTFSLEYFGRTAFIEDLYIKPEHRKQGLGRQALEVAEAECRKRGVLALHLEVEERNNPANTLYERFGFRAPDRKLLSKRFGNVNDKK
jgi:ribosomal protein S18 acetylase RimI-like enzyme